MLFGRGDDRAFYELFDPYQARATIVIDFDRGVAAAMAQPSCSRLVLGCLGALPFGMGENRNQIWIDETGTTIVGSLRNAITTSPAIDFRIELNTNAGRIIGGSIVSDVYPSYEVYYDSSDRGIHTLHTHPEAGGAPLGLIGDPVGWGGPWLMP